MIEVGPSLGRWNDFKGFKRAWKPWIYCRHSVGKFHKVQLENATQRTDMKKRLVADNNTKYKLYSILFIILFWYQIFIDTQKYPTALI